MVAVRDYLKRKKDAIIAVLETHTVARAVLVGDSKHDLDAAFDANIDFVLRKTKHNDDIAKSFNGLMINDFR